MKVITFLIFLFLTSLINAQEKDIIKGTVRDKDKNPVPFVTVAIKNDNITISGTNTDINGQYQIAVADTLKKFTIVYSLLGMKTKEIEINLKEDEKTK
jgi:hypothetical protein